MANEIDPVTLTLLIIYNSIILGMILKWLMPEMRKIKEVITS